jgi:hypothetical protein
MPRQLQSKIHSDFSSETYKWEIYQAQAQELFDNSTSKADFNAHLIREYNRKINNLNQPSQLYFQPYDAGFSLTSNVLDGLKLSLDLNFDANTTYSQSTVGDSTFTLASRYGPNALFSRLSLATFRGSNGLIQYAPENLLQRSEEFDNAYWYRDAGIRPFGSGSVANTTQTTDPLGGNTADKLVEVSGAVTAASVYLASGSIPTSSGIMHTATIYVKTAGRRYVGLYANAVPTSAGAYFDLQDGVVTLIGANNLQRSITSVGNNWWRLSIAFLTTTNSVGFSVFMSDNGTGPSYTGDGTSGIYIWGAQLERSSTARPYISTTTTERYGPRFEYDANGNPLGLLMEESSENLVWYGNSLETTGSKWQGLASGAASSITLNNTTSPTGIVNSASLLTFNTAVTGAGSYSIWRQNYATTTSGTYTFSVWLRSGSNSSVYIRINDSTGNKGKLLCNLTTSWQRFVITSTTSGTITGVSVDIGADGNAGETMTAGNIYVWGAQLEAKPFVTSYIPTAASGGIVRAADTCTLNIDLGNSWFNESEGTIMVEGDRLHSPALNVPSLDSLFAFSSGGSPSITHYCDGASEFFSLADGSYIVTALSVSLPNQPLLFVGSYSASSSEIYVSTNNTATQSEAGFSPFSTPDTITLGYSDTINIYLNGHIKSFKYYKKSLDSTIMEALPL